MSKIDKAKWSHWIGIIYGGIATVFVLMKDFQSATAVVAIGATLKGWLGQGGQQ